jgi:cell division protein FtsB
VAGDRDRRAAARFPTTSARLRALGRQAQATVYRASGRRPAGSARRSRFTGRAAVLALVLCSLVVALAYPTRQYIAQRARIAEQRHEVEDARRRVERLREEKARWRDPAYVRTQAREHLHYVMPGETGYTVLGSPSPGPTPAPSERAEAGRPWYQNLWDGLDEADRAPDHAAAAPSATPRER